jgi:peptide/nickel transport system substrate-binding protein
MKRNPVPPLLRPADADRPRRRLVKPLAGLLSVAALAAGLSACGGSTSAATAQTSGSSKPVSGGTIYYAHDLEVPCLQGGWVEEAYVERQYADSLVSQVSSGHIVPWLATAWSVSKNQLTWTFHLKPGVKFSDGTPLNAQAVVDNFYYWTNPKTANGDVDAYLGPYFKSAKAVGDLTVQLNLKAPYSPLLSSLSQGYDGILSPKGLARGVNANCDDPIGSGPFIIQQWNHGQDIVFVRNPHYNSAPANALHQGPPYVDKLVWSFIADPTTRWASLTTGESDVIEDVPTADWEQAKSEYGLDEYVTPGRPQTLSLNTDLGVFTDQKVRQAFAYAANRRAAVQSAFNGEIPFDGNGALSPSTPDFDAALENAYPYSPAKANALLNEAGWTGRDAAGYRRQARLRPRFDRQQRGRHAAPGPSAAVEGGRLQRHAGPGDAHAAVRRNVRGADGGRRDDRLLDEPDARGALHHLSVLEHAGGSQLLQQRVL